MSIGSSGGHEHAPAVLATYVHQLDPVIIDLFGKLPLRWYGLAYLAGFMAGYFLLKRLAEKKLWVMQPEKTADFIAAAALLGVFIGGRLGYIFFYQIPKDGWASFLDDPFILFRVWEGGMASHGGILGLAIFTFFYARKHRVSWAGLADGLCVVGPIGLLCGRIANFINGELYGRVANGVSWAVKFPDTLIRHELPEYARFNDALTAAVKADSGFAIRIKEISAQGFADPRLAHFHELIATNRGLDGRESDSVNQAIAPYLEARHPSQLYEGLLEGALIFGILWFIRVRFPKAPHGMITGIFFGLYATFRIFAEAYREPDAAWVIDDFLTKGQFLSLFMYIFAAAFLILAFRKSRTVI